MSDYATLFSCVVSQPVVEQLVGCRLPVVERRLRGVVVKVVVYGYVYRQPFVHIAFVLLVESVKRILAVARDKEVPCSFLLHYVHSRFGRLRQQFQARLGNNVLAVYVGVSAVGNIYYVVEVGEQRVFGVRLCMWEYAEHLFGQQVFLNAELMV